MRLDVPYAWPAGEAEALALQERLRPLADHRGPGPAAPRLVAGLDVAYAGDGRGTGDLVAAAVVVIDTATLGVVERATAVATTAFPYVPGLFAFRELPALVAALRKLTTTPDLLLCDGHGRSHPRRFGLACHLGVLTGLPTAGVAKTPSPGGTTRPPSARTAATTPTWWTTARWSAARCAPRAASSRSTSPPAI